MAEPNLPMNDCFSRCGRSDAFGLLWCLNSERLLLPWDVHYLGRAHERTHERSDVDSSGLLGEDLINFTLTGGSWSAD